MTLEELWDALPLPVATWGRHMIQMEWAPPSLDELGGVYLAPDGYHLIVNKDKIKAATAPTFLLHELAHIFRGDCLRKEKHPKLMNLAADCLINHNLDRDDIEKLGGVFYIPFAKELDLPTNYLVSTHVLYDAMVKMGDQYRKDHPQGCMFGEVSQRGDPTDCETAHADTVLSARGAVLQELEKAIGGKLEGLALQAGNNNSSGRKVRAPEPLPLALSDQIIRKLKSLTGTSQRVRSWRRPGRVEVLRGSAFEPKYKLLVAVDVSGSCISAWPTLGGVCAYLCKRHSVDMCVFDTEACKTKSLTDLPIFGGGTLIQPVFALLNRGKYDALIVLTDGELFDWPGEAGLPDVPIIWIVLNGRLGCVKLRDKDVMIPISIRAEGSSS